MTGYTGHQHSPLVRSFNGTDLLTVPVCHTYPRDNNKQGAGNERKVTALVNLFLCCEYHLSRKLKIMLFFRFCHM
jgi:hypothetical protein